MRVNSQILFFAFSALAILLCNSNIAQAQGAATFEAIGPAKDVAEGSRFELSF
jgi:hypothetical protein